MRRNLNIPTPNTNGGSTPLSVPSNAIVIVGANGSGKTRFGTFIEENNRDAHRITAQKSLTMPDDISTKSLENAKKEFLYGGTNDNQTEEWLQTVGKKSFRYHNKPSTHLLSDYFSLMSLLFSDEFDVSIKFRDAVQNNRSPEKTRSKLDIVIEIWQEIITHRSLHKSSGKITAKTIYNNAPSLPLHVFPEYKSSEMSDGERVIFYLIGEAVCTSNESILIIDEPELHLHKVIIKKLFDKIEEARPDVLFVYLTHDVDFAASRIGSTKIWLRSYIHWNYWQYEILPNDTYWPEQIYLEILGSRKNILFIEGDKTSIDYQLYSLLFQDKTVTPIGGCSKVIESTKAFNDINSFHHLSAQGIIDRDRRSDQEVNIVEKNGIYVLKLAEIENLFLLEEVVKILANRMGQNENEVFSFVKQKVIDIFSQEIERQTTEYTIYYFKRQISNSIDPAQNWDSLELGLKDVFNINTYQNLYDEIKMRFEGFVVSQDYLAILKVANTKRLLIRSELAIKCKLHNSEDAVRNLVMHIIKSKETDSHTICQVMTSLIF